MKSTIRLFKAVPVKSKGKKTDKTLNKTLLEKTIRKGFVFAPEVIASYPDCDQLLKIVEEVFGMTPEKMNSSFHKSWKKIEEADIVQLVLEQMVHYITTYGFEQMGIYSEESVYVPKEKLDIPDLEIENINLVVIKGYTKNELKEKLIEFLASGIALKENTKNDVLDIATYAGFSEKEVESVRNREVKIALYDYLNMFPSDPVEFLRYAVYKATNETLLIKNSELIEKIKEKNNLGVLRLFSEYEEKYGLERLAEVFYRFKPIFLAFRTNKRMKVLTNKVRRLAENCHKPMPEDYLNAVTAKLKKGEELESDKLSRELEKVNTFRKVRLAYALKYRTKDVDSILYRVRNGKSYATDFTFGNSKGAEDALKIVLDSVVGSVASNVKGKKIYIPDYINYALPATEKQYTGDFPSGTYVSVPEDMIVGVNWNNVSGKRIDLDLSLVSAGEKVGWNSLYRTNDGDVLFSGDMTDAQGENGATELFYIKRQISKSFIVFLNYYNYEKEVEVPFKIVVAKEKVKNFGESYMVNPNNLLSVAETKADKKQKMLGLLVVSPEESRFYFAETNIGNSITSRNSELAEHSRNYLFNFYKDSIYLKDILEKAGAVLVESKENADIDLSPEKIERDSITKLL